MLIASPPNAQSRDWPLHMQPRSVRTTRREARDATRKTSSVAHIQERTIDAGGKPRAERRAGGCHLARARLRDWYSNELESKVARAVAEGHVAASQAADLHRLVVELLDADVSARPETNTDADGRVSR
jgi:hypothetical protein